MNELITASASTAVHNLDQCTLSELRAKRRKVLQRRTRAIAYDDRQIISIMTEKLAFIDVYIRKLEASKESGKPE